MSITDQAIGLAAWEHERRGWHGEWGSGTGPEAAHALKALPSGSFSSADYKRAIKGKTARNVRRGDWVAWADDVFSGGGLVAVFRPVQITSARHHTTGRGRKRHPYVTLTYDDGTTQTVRAGSVIDTIDPGKLGKAPSPTHPKPAPSPTHPHDPFGPGWLAHEPKPAPSPPAPGPPHPLPKGKEPGDIGATIAGGYDKAQYMMAMSEAQRGLDIQARYLPGLARRQKINITNDLGSGTPKSVLGQEESANERIDLRPKIFDAFSSEAATGREKRQAEVRGWWTQTDPQHSLSDVTVAHEFGHVVGEELPDRYSKDLWDGLAKQLGMSPPTTFYDPVTRRHLVSPDDWVAANKDELAVLISEYGSSDHFELEAELWRNYTMNSHPGPVAKWYGDFMMAHLPKRDK